MVRGAEGVKCGVYARRLAVFVQSGMRSFVAQRALMATRMGRSSYQMTVTPRSQAIIGCLAARR